MSMYDDTKHRPHSKHTGQAPMCAIDIGPDGLYVSLDAWGPSTNVYAHLYNQLQSNWGEDPSMIEKDSQLTEGQMAYVEKCIAGKTLPNVLESVSTMWTISGCSRAFTHQFVRTRVGASFMQHGGRDNDWRHRRWRMPETIWRACTEKEGKLEEGLKSCVQDCKPINDFLVDKYPELPLDEISLFAAIQDYLMDGKELYSALVDAGIPWQDARRLLHMGTETYIHANYNFLALKGVIANRMEFIMDWEINAVSQLMVREVRMKMPKLFGQYLGSHSDAQGRAAFAGLDSWPPDQKFPALWKQSERTHRPEQMPFFVLTERAINGGEVEWIRTNGTYPNRERGEVVEQGEDGFPKNAGMESL